MMSCLRLRIRFTMSHMICAVFFNHFQFTVSFHCPWALAENELRRGERGGTLKSWNRIRNEKLGAEVLLGNSHYRILSPTWPPGSISQVLGDRLELPWYYQCWKSVLNTFRDFHAWNMYFLKNKSLNIFFLIYYIYGIIHPTVYLTFEVA